MTAPLGQSMREMLELMLGGDGGLEFPTVPRERVPSSSTATTW